MMHRCAATHTLLSALGADGRGPAAQLLGSQPGHAGAVGQPGRAAHCVPRPVSGQPAAVCYAVPVQLAGAARFTLCACAYGVRVGVGRPETLKAGMRALGPTPCTYRASGHALSAPPLPTDAVFPAARTDERPCIRCDPCSQKKRPVALLSFQTSSDWRQPL